MILLRKILKYSIHIRSASWYVEINNSYIEHKICLFSISFRTNELARFSDGSAIAQVIIFQNKMNKFI